MTDLSHDDGVHLITYGASNSATCTCGWSSRAAHGDDLDTAVTDHLSRTRDITVKVEHRCPRMAEHLAGWAAGIRPGGYMHIGAQPGETPGDLPVPCPSCYSVTVITVPQPWRPSSPSQPLSRTRDADRKDRS